MQSNSASVRRISLRKMTVQIWCLWFCFRKVNLNLLLVVFMHLLQNSKCYKEGPTPHCLLALCTSKWQCPISFPGWEKPFVLCTVAIIRLKKNLENFRTFQRGRRPPYCSKMFRSSGAEKWTQKSRDSRFFLILFKGRNGSSQAPIIYTQASYFRVQNEIQREQMKFEIIGTTASSKRESKCWRI